MVAVIFRKEKAMNYYLNVVFYCAAVGREAVLRYQSCLATLSSGRLSSPSKEEEAAAQERRGKMHEEWLRWPEPKCIVTTRMGGQPEISGMGTPPGWEWVDDQEDWHSAWREWIRAYESGLAKSEA